MSHDSAVQTKIPRNRVAQAPGLKFEDPCGDRVSPADPELWTQQAAF